MVWGEWVGDCPDALPPPPPPFPQNKKKSRISQHIVRVYTSYIQVRSAFRIIISPRERFGAEVGGRREKIFFELENIGIITFYLSLSLFPFSYLFPFKRQKKVSYVCICKCNYLAKHIISQRSGKQSQEKRKKKKTEKNACYFPQCFPRSPAKQKKKDQANYSV